MIDVGNGKRGVVSWLLASVCRYLDLGSNLLTGTIPSTITALTSLTYAGLNFEESAFCVYLRPCAPWCFSGAGAHGSHCCDVGHTP